MSLEIEIRCNLLSDREQMIYNAGFKEGQKDNQVEAYALGKKSGRQELIEDFKELFDLKGIQLLQ